MDRGKRIVRALQRPPEPIDVRGARRWRWAPEPWRDWLRRSATGVELFTRRHEGDEYRYLLGDGAYRDQLVEVLGRAVPRDCAAAGFGCTRRIDRSCYGPETCSLDRAGDDERVRREGPLPGACDSFHLEFSHGHVWIEFSAGDRHRAVLWWETSRQGLWIDGARIDSGHSLDSSGRWLDDRFFMVHTDGPEDHPAQAYGMGHLASRIRSVLLHDAEQSSTRLLVPEPGEMWTYPWLVRDGDALLVYADDDDLRAGIAPARTLPVSSG